VFSQRFKIDLLKVFVLLITMLIDIEFCFTPLRSQMFDNITSYLFCQNI